MSQRSYFPSVADLQHSDRFVLFYENKVVVRGDDFIWSQLELRDDLLHSASMFIVHEDDGQDFVAVQLSEDPVVELDAEHKSLRHLLFSPSDLAFTVAGKANQILEWYDSHKHCGRCGAPTTHHASERAVNCEACKQQYYPRINPCAIMLVVKGDQLLLARSSRFNSGFFSCLAGFIEVGETPEETVAREVREEVGLEVENIRYLKSQSWPFPSQLMLGFIADYKSGVITPEPEEIAEANWYDVDDMPNVPSAKISVAGELIQYFIKQVRVQ